MWGLCSDSFSDGKEEFQGHIEEGRVQRCESALRALEVKPPTASDTHASLGTNHTSCTSSWDGFRGCSLCGPFCPFSLWWRGQPHSIHPRKGIQDIF